MMEYEYITFEVQWHAVWGSVESGYTGAICQVFGREVFSTKKDAEAYLDAEGWPFKKGPGRRMKEGLYSATAQVHRTEERDPAKWKGEIKC